MKYFYHISQSENNEPDTYSDLVVCAPTAYVARETHPYERFYLGDDIWTSPTWCSSPEQVSVKLIGIAADSVELGIVCASFHSG